MEGCICLFLIAEKGMKEDLKAAMKTAHALMVQKSGMGKTEDPGKTAEWTCITRWSHPDAVPYTGSLRLWNRKSANNSKWIIKLLSEI